jgi:hypothetical protein
MPTGYTDKVLKGSTFEEFALDTASAFSHLAQSINEKGDLHAPLPDPEKAARSYHDERVAEAQKTLKNSLKMSFASAARKAQKEYDEEKQSLTEALSQTIQNGFKLEKMIQQVLEYEAPDTEAHKAHKKYMLDQLKTTMEHDADPKYYNERLGELKLLTAQEWKEKTIKQAKSDIEYHSAEAEKDRARARESVSFLANLRAAVKPGPKT